MWININVKVYNKFMCHLSMKLSDKFDPNQMYASGHSKQQNNKQGNKIFHLL